MMLTEKFTRVAYDVVNYEFTVEDPSTYMDKITAIVPMSKVAGQIYEYACHEGNYGMVNTLRGARMEEKMERDVSDLRHRFVVCYTQPFHMILTPIIGTAPSSKKKKHADRPSSNCRTKRLSDKKQNVS